MLVEAKVLTFPLGRGVSFLTSCTKGWVNFEAVPQAGKPDKKIYCITEGGWRELTRWYTEPTEPTPIREDLLVQVLIGHKMPRQLLVNQVKHRQQIHSAQLKEYREIETEYLSRDSLGNSDRDLEAQFEYLTLKRGIAYETSWLSWCEDVMAMVDNLREDMTFETAAEKFRRAQSLIAVEQLFEALPLLDELTQVEPGWAQVYVQRARIRKRLGNKEGAIADYAKAIKLTPTAELYLARALVWLSLSQEKGAIADSRQAIALRPELAGGHRLLGKALGLLGDGESAIAAYKQAARCYLNEKDKENAQQCINAIAPLRDLPPFVPPLNLSPSSDLAKANEGSEETSPWLDQASAQQAVENDSSIQQTNTQPTEGNRKESTVPIKSFERHLPVVEAMFDGIAKVDVTIDRNAPNSLIPQRIAKQLGLKEVSYQYVYLANGTPMELSIARLRSVVIGAVIVTDVEIAILPKSSAANALNNATIILGKNCFSAYRIRINGNEMAFARR